VLLVVAADRKKKKWLPALWAALAICVGLSLVVGSGAIGTGHAKPPSLYQRTLQVAGEYRCPVCAGESVAASQAPEAVEIRQLVEHWLQQGDSQATIRSFLVHDYGLSILERPPASGVTVLVWILPVLAGALAITGLGLGFVRWRRATVLNAAPDAGAVLAQPAPAPGDGGALSVQDDGGAMVVQERLFEVAVARESPTGESLIGEKVAETAEMRPRRRLRQRVTLVAGAALVLLAGALWLVDRSSSARLPGATITGGLGGVNAQLQEASALTASDPTQALGLYDDVLSGDPDQPVALTAEGWIYAQAGIVPKAMGLLEKAESADPGYDLPHLYRALVLLDDQGQVVAAARELNWYLAHGPDPAMVKVARKALAEAQASGAKGPTGSKGNSTGSAKKLPAKS
jgi:cytochrome c-type biogenesis protein CcmH/NrfF